MARDIPGADRPESALDQHATNKAAGEKAALGGLLGSKHGLVMDGDLVAVFRNEAQQYAVPYGMARPRALSRPGHSSLAWSSASPWPSHDPEQVRLPIQTL
ncbi:uncharacterized protein LOC117653256 [Thrips palmi]|uniref:Uncharacterized protein LOC117653256 n=1 Tax=Thrips palmi TaxID=161013 RepID=A0A6P9A9J5_THRPL|nr:uncharacterized protein LOC117653256 [Thrips palmi]